MYRICQVLVFSRRLLFGGGIFGSDILKQYEINAGWYKSTIPMEVFIN